MDQKENIMNYETVALDDQDHSIVIIDQTLLPGRTELIRLRTAQEIWNAIYLLQVRGAPAIGVTAAFGIYLLARQIQMENIDNAGTGTHQRKRSSSPVCHPAALRFSESAYCALFFSFPVISVSASPACPLFSPYLSAVISPYSPLQAFKRSSGFSSIWEPILPPLTMIVSCSFADSSSLVTNCFFMPIAVHPPLM